MIINDEDEFVIPQSAAHFLDFVYPTVLHEEEFIVDGDELFESVNGGRSLLQSSCASKSVYAQSEENCGTFREPCVTAIHLFGDIEGAGIRTVAETCRFSIYSANCQSCRPTNVWLGESELCQGNTKFQTLEPCESGTENKLTTAAMQMSAEFEKSVFLGCWKDSSDHAMLKFIGEGYEDYDHESCYRAYAEFPYKYFGIQNYDQCFCSSDYSTTTGLRKYGNSTNCVQNKEGLVVGRGFSNAVYTVPSCFPRYGSCADTVRTCDSLGAPHLVQSAPRGPFVLTLCDSGIPISKFV